MVLHRLDHEVVLLRRVRHLHSAGAANGRVGHVAIAANLGGGVDDDHPLVEVVRQDAGQLPDDGRLAHARTAQQEQAVGGVQQVPDHVRVAGHSAPDATCEANDLAAAVAYAADAMQRARQPRPVVSPEGPQLRLRRLKLLVRHLRVPQLLAAGHLQEAGLWAPAKVQDNLQQGATARRRLQALPHVQGQHLRECRERRAT